MLTLIYLNVPLRQNVQYEKTENDISYFFRKGTSLLFPVGKKQLFFFWLSTNIPAFIYIYIIYRNKLLAKRI